MRYLILILISTISLYGENKTTRHSVQLNNGLLVYEAKVGTFPAKNKEGVAKGEIGYIAYLKEGTETNRPITFIFNGGPGSSSVWLHLGMFGPRRVVGPEEGALPTP